MRVSELIKNRKLIIGSVLVTGVWGLAMALPGVTASALSSSKPLLDTFDGPDGVITSPESYASTDFPKSGTSKASNPSSVWEGDSGKFYRQANWGYSGKTADWGNKYFFRYNTRDHNIGDADISWQYKSAQPGTQDHQDGDAVDVWLRYQTQYNLYVFQFDRANDAFLAKRKVPGQGWSGPSIVSNKGVYYSLPTDSQQPKLGAGAYEVKWAKVESLLPASEKSKPGFPNLAHDGKTAYDFRVTVRNIAGGKVQIQAYRAGALIYSATDDGVSGVAADNETQGTHISKGYYNSVPGWQTAWGKPITNKGASGFRSDNIEFWVNNFRVATKGIDTKSPAPAKTSAKPKPTPKPKPNATSSHSSKALTTSLTTTSTWADGYCATVKVTNNSKAKITNWSITTPVRGHITSLWNAQWSQSGQTLTVRNPHWNTAITPGQPVKDVGFCATL